MTSGPIADEQSVSPGFIPRSTDVTDADKISGSVFFIVLLSGMSVGVPVIIEFTLNTESLKALFFKILLNDDVINVIWTLQSRFQSFFIEIALVLMGIRIAIFRNRILDSQGTGSSPDPPQG